MPNTPLEKRYTIALEYLKFYKEMAIQFPCHDWINRINKIEQEIEMIKMELSNSIA
jgi:hypothetical protein